MEDLNHSNGHDIGIFPFTNLYHYFFQFKSSSFHFYFLFIGISCHSSGRVPITQANIHKDPVWRILEEIQ